MEHPRLPRISRFPFTLLLCGLLWAALGRVSLADDLFADGDIPTVYFDDTGSSINPDWRIVADQTEFYVVDDENSVIPFRIFLGAPSNSIAVQNTGNVGLGTSGPTQKLHLVSGNTPSIRLEQDTSLALPPKAWLLRGNHIGFFVENASAPQLTTPFLVFAGAPHSALALTGSGLGLGVQSPQGNLHIFGAANKDIFNGMGPDLSAGPAFNFGYSGNSFGPGSGFFNVRGANSGVNPSLRFATANVQRLIVTNAGRVGIGTLAPSVALDVVGTVRASTSLMVGGQTLNVPDYVFEPDYKLRPLAEVALYVAKEKHLPDVPSAREIKEQGVNVSELQMQLLKKVEELTLYAVEQERINHQQTQILREQGKLLRQLTARLAVLERTRQ